MDAGVIQMIEIKTLIGRWMEQALEPVLNFG